MGVNISDLVSRKEISFDALKGKIIAVDAYNALYQFLSSIRGADGSPLQDSKGRVTSHLQGLFSRTSNLMSKGIKLVYVFDGKAPVLKLQEQERRRHLKEGAEEKYQEALEEEDIELMSKYSRQFSRLNSEMIKESKELLETLGLPVIEAPSEAEAQAAHMCSKGDVYAVASSDYDALLFGSPRLVRNLTLSQKRKVPGGKYVHTFLEFVELEKMLNELCISREQLIVLGILVGTDFNIGGVKGIGPKKALKLVQASEHNFKTLFDDLDVRFDWKEIYELFKHIPVTDSYTLKWKDVDEKKVRKLLVDEHDFSLERVNSSLEKLYEMKEKDQKGLNSFF